MFKSVQYPCSKPTRRPCDLHSTDIDLPPRYRIPARHCIKRRHRSVESTVSMVNRRHHQRPRDSLRIGIREIPARAARGGVPGHDGGGGGDVREGREVSEIVKASGDEAVLPVGARDGGEAIGGDTVVVVVAQDDAHRGGEKDEECGERVLHFGWLVDWFFWETANASLSEPTTDPSYFILPGCFTHRSANAVASIRCPRPTASA